MQGREEKMEATAAQVLGPGEGGGNIWCKDFPKRPSSALPEFANVTGGVLSRVRLGA
jgi:hypothetical protein